MSSQKRLLTLKTVTEAFDWFIGSGMDDATLAALQEDEVEQKRLAAKELGL